MMYLDPPADFNSKLDIISCFLEHNGRFLLLHRNESKPQGGTWGAPAGKVEKGEDRAAAMVRELEEETVFRTSESDLKFDRTVYVRFPEYDFVYHI